jgi:hypothetical protein
MKCPKCHSTELIETHDLPYVSDVHEVKKYKNTFGCNCCYYLFTEANKLEIFGRGGYP